MEYSQRVGKARNEAKPRKIHKFKEFWLVRTWRGERDSQKCWISSWRDLGVKFPPWHRGIGILEVKFPLDPWNWKSGSQIPISFPSNFPRGATFGLFWLNWILEKSQSLELRKDLLGVLKFLLYLHGIYSIIPTFQIYYFVSMIPRFIGFCAVRAAGSRFFFPSLPKDI